MSSFATAGAAKKSDVDDGLAPEATAEEATLSFRDIPDLDKAFIDTTPTDRKDALALGELGVDGGQKDIIVKLAQEMAEGKHGSYDSLLIVHKGKLLFESYYSRGRVNLPHYQASTTKAYTNLAIGRAIQMGYLTMADLDKPLTGFLNQLDPEKFVEGAERITLHKAMTMRSGLRFSEEQKEEINQNPDWLRGQGQVQTYLERSAPISSDSQSFLYQGRDPQLVMQVLDAVVPGTAKDFIKTELLGKIGIADHIWRTDVSGLPSAPSGARMTSRDMVKWGILAKNEGKWNGEQLIPERFIARSTNSIVRIGNDDIFFTGNNVSNPSYGYYWWQAEMKVGDRIYFTRSAQGGGGQYIILIDELDLMVVTTGHERDDKTMQITAERILPAFTSQIAKSRGGLAKTESTELRGPYLGQTPPGSTPKVFAPGIVSTEHRDFSPFFSPDMREFYFTRKNLESEKWSLISYRSENNRWRESVIRPRVWRPNISPDGKTMHLGKYYMERTDNGWSEIKSLGPMFDREDLGIMRLSASASGTYILDDYKGDNVIRISTLKDGKREEPRPLGKEINTGKLNAHPFIAPDESYIIWDGERDGGFGGIDLWISFKQQDGSWGDAINMGPEINTIGREASAYVTPDGKYLFFNRTVPPAEGDIYWVDAQIIENLRPK
ncbi:MAG: serine hydrolase [Parasphingorhabdus sp.]|uniref:serine hydrolase n=1 Tax=Parasphingorhabdus sp. TaxID=2709688 RepID=UPI003296D043